MRNKIKLKEYHYAIILLAISIILFIVYLPWLKTELINYDSAYQYSLNCHSLKEIFRLLPQDYSPPLYTLIEKLFTFFFGETLFAMRCVNVLLTVCMVFLALFPVRKVFGNVVCFISALFFALSNFSFTYVMEIRPTFIAYCTITYVVFYAYYISFIDSGNKYICIFTAFVILAMYSHNFTMIACITAYFVLFIFSIIQKDKTKMIKYIISGLVSALAYLPWLGIVLKQYSSVKENYWEGEITSFIEILADGSIVAFFNNSLLFAILLLLVLTVPIIVLQTKKKNKANNVKITSFVLKSKRLQKAAFLFFMWIMPLFVMWLFITFVYPLGVDRYCNIFTGVFILLLSVLIGKTDIKYLPIVFSVLLIANFEISYVKTYNELKNETFSDMIEYIKDENIDESHIVFLHREEWSIGMMTYYFPNAQHYVYDDTWTVLNTYDVFLCGIHDVGEIHNIENYCDKFYYFDNYYFSDTLDDISAAFDNSEVFSTQKIGAYEVKGILTYGNEWYLFSAEKRTEQGV